MTPPGAVPFDRDHLETLFAGLREAPALLLAVSGGADSMALLHLVHAWRADRPAPTLHVATVDHRLRVGAAAEAAFVAAVSTSLGLPHATLVWEGARPGSRLQERARAARAALLAGRARTVGATAVLTGHHADDQAETVLMRLGRGSGLDGLAGMRRQTSLAPGVSLVRPLLGVSKSALVAFCHGIGQAFVDDPSNLDPAYARARLRLDADASARLGLDRTTLLRLAGRASRAEAALEAEASRVASLLAPERLAGVWRASLDVADALEPEILIRVLRRAIGDVVGPRPIRLDRLERMAEALPAHIAAGRAWRTTLAGAAISLTHQSVITVQPEPERRRGRRGEGACARGPTPRSGRDDALPTVEVDGAG